MKISELIKLHGVPVKLSRDGWPKDIWFEVIAESRGKEYPGFSTKGEVLSFLDSGDWELYVAPKPKKKLYAWVNKNMELDAYFLAFTESPTYSIYQTRAPQFDCEIDS